MDLLDSQKIVGKVKSGWKKICQQENEVAYFCQELPFMQFLKNSAFWIEWRTTKKVASWSNFLCLGKLVDYTLFLNFFWINFFEDWLNVLSRSPTWAVFIRKKTSIFWSIHGSEIRHFQILLKFHRIFHLLQLLDVQIVIGQTFTLKKTLYFCKKIFPYALADGPVTYIPLSFST